MKKSLIVFFLMMITGFFCNLQAQETGIKVMSFNIRYNNPDDGENAWPQRKDQVVSVVRFHHAAIIGFQEVQADQLSYLEKALPEYRWCGVGRLAGGRGEEYCAIFYLADRYELLESETFWLSETPEVKVSKSWDSSLPRICTIAILKHKISGEKLVMMNTHFDHRGELARKESARLIAARAKDYKDYPLVLTGDFNCEIDSEPLAILGSELKEASAVSRLTSHGPRWSFHGFKGYQPGNKLIDFIFVNENLEILRHGLLVDNLNGHYPSDHLPVLVEILFKKR